MTLETKAGNVTFQAESFYNGRLHFLLLYRRSTLTRRSMRITAA